MNRGWGRGKGSGSVFGVGAWRIKIVIDVCRIGEVSHPGPRCTTTQPDRAALSHSPSFLPPPPPPRHLQFNIRCVVKDNKEQLPSAFLPQTHSFQHRTPISPHTSPSVHACTQNTRQFPHTSNLPAVFFILFSIVSSSPVLSSFLFYSHAIPKHGTFPPSPQRTSWPARTQQGVFNPRLVHKQHTPPCPLYLYISVGFSGKNANEPHAFCFVFLLVS